MLVNNTATTNMINGVADDVEETKKFAEKVQSDVITSKERITTLEKSSVIHDEKIYDLEKNLSQVRDDIKQTAILLNFATNVLQILVASFIVFVIALIMLAVKVSAYEYTAEDIVQIGKIVQHECPNESELGKRLVIDTILNRVESDAFPNTVAEVLNQKGQYCNPKKYSPKEVYTLIAQEINDRTDKRVLWFKTNWYHSFGEPIVKEGSHYFSGR